MNYIDVLNHYKRDIVRREITEWVKNKWVAIHCQERDENGRLIFIRYMDKKPLSLDSPEDLKKLMERFKRLRPRTIYASINEYKVLSDVSNVYDLDNIIASTPTWDIDNKLEDWKTTIKIGRFIGELVMKEGVHQGLYYIWSGRGLHLHIHPYSFSRKIRGRYNPLDISYAIVEFIRSEFIGKFPQFNIGLGGSIKIENKMDIARVFTAPLSIHRELDLVTVALKYGDLENFGLSWLDINKFKHNMRWREYVEGEADDLAFKAYEAVGGYPYNLRYKIRKTKPVDEMIRDWLDRYG